MNSEQESNSKTVSAVRAAKGRISATVEHLEMDKLMSERQEVSASSPEISLLPWIRRAVRPLQVESFRMSYTQTAKNASVGHAVTLMKERLSVDPALQMSSACKEVQQARGLRSRGMAHAE